MANETAAGPAWRGAWRRCWAERHRTGTSGAEAGTGGDAWRPFLRALPIIVGLIVLIDTVNVLSALHDAARRGEALAAWEPITWEATSGIVELVACPILYAALLAARPGRDQWRRTLPVHAVASLAFSAVHVALMMALRIGIYGAAGYRYHVEPGAALYEYRKDLLAYLVLGGVFHLLSERRAPATSTPEPSSPETLVIGDGRRVWRVPPDEVLALRSAGNYVEFLLFDGSRPLVRTTLTEWEHRLVSAGFVRTHRSWLLNPRRVRHVAPTGSGDYVVELASDVVVPVSRRFSSVLDKLKE